MEVRFNIDDSYIKSLQESLGGAKSPEVTKSALTLLNWAVSEVSKGRVILSADSKGEDIHRLAMPALDSVRPQGQPVPAA